MPVMPLESYKESGSIQSIQFFLKKVLSSLLPSTSENGISQLETKVPAPTRANPPAPMAKIFKASEEVESSMQVNSSSLRKQSAEQFRHLRRSLLLALSPQVLQLVMISQHFWHQRPVLLGRRPPSQASHVSQPLQLGLQAVQFVMLQNSQVPLVVLCRQYPSLQAQQVVLVLSHRRQLGSSQGTASTYQQTALLSSSRTSTYLSMLIAVPLPGKGFYINIPTQLYIPHQIICFHRQFYPVQLHNTYKQDLST